MCSQVAQIDKIQKENFHFHMNIPVRPPNFDYRTHALMITRLDDK